MTPEVCAPEAGIKIVEDDGVRFLLIGGDAIQSGIHIKEPDRLALDYIRAMMAFLLFRPHPRDVLMIGLGGGTMARFIHQRMLETSVTVVEINPDVQAAARKYFHFPANDERMQVLIGDGAEVVPARPASADVLVVDGFNDGEMAEALSTQSFYNAAYDCLRDGGVMVVNFMADDKELARNLGRIETSFGRTPTLIMAEEKDNLIAFAMRGNPQVVSWEKLKASAIEANVLYGLQLEKCFASLRRRNPSEDGSLTL